MCSFGPNKHSEGVTLGSLAHCEHISHYFHSLDKANNQCIDGEKNQQIDPEWKESLVAVLYKIAPNELHLNQLQQENPALTWMQESQESTEIREKRRADTPVTVTTSTLTTFYW